MNYAELDFEETTDAIKSLQSHLKTFEEVEYTPTMTPFQWRTALRLARAYNHARGYGPWTEELTVGFDAVEADTLASWDGVLTPGITAPTWDPALQFLVHTTGSGRLEWCIGPRSVNFNVFRPNGHHRTAILHGYTSGAGNLTVKSTGAAYAFRHQTALKEALLTVVDDVQAVEAALFEAAAVRAPMCDVVVLRDDFDEDNPDAWAIYPQGYVISDPMSLAEIMADLRERPGCYAASYLLANAGHELIPLELAAEFTAVRLGIREYRVTG